MDRIYRIKRKKLSCVFCLSVRLKGNNMTPLFGKGKIFIGVIHLPPLPGSPRWAGDMASVLERAEREAQVLEQGGANGIIVENFGDAPFRIGRVEPETVAAMTRAVDRVCQVTSLPVGVNMLRSDAISALAVAVAAGARFIRVNVHYGTMAADEGVVTGEAFETLRRRRLLDADSNVAILADVLVKHAVPLGEPVVRKAVPDRLLLVGSGVDANNAAQFLTHADGAIIGTSLKQDGRIANPIDPERVRATAAAFGGEGKGNEV